MARAISRSYVTAARTPTTPTQRARAFVPPRTLPARPDGHCFFAGDALTRLGGPPLSGWTSHTLLIAGRYAAIPAVLACISTRTCTRGCLSACGIASSSARRGRSEPLAGRPSAAPRVVVICVPVSRTVPVTSPGVSAEAPASCAVAHIISCRAGRSLLPPMQAPRENNHDARLPPGDEEGATASQYQLDKIIPSGLCFPS